MVAVLLVFVVCLAVVLVLRVVLENVKFDLNDKPLCNLAVLTSTTTDEDVATMVIPSPRGDGRPEYHKG